MKLLFDENLSPDLPGSLKDSFPSSAHIRDIRLGGADDEVIWQFAAEHNFILVTKDDDFFELSVLRGSPPKVILIRLGNCRTADVAALLLAQKPKLEQFERVASASLIELS